MPSDIGFEYTNKRDETPFETFLRYTDEKEQSAAQLAAILVDQAQGDAFSVLDVGTGNGEYLELALNKAAQLPPVTLALIEQSPDLAGQLESRFKEAAQGQRLRIVQSAFEDFSSEEMFDVVLMSHLFYHVPRTSWTEQLTKALGFLKPDGVLVIVLREKDDAYDFKMAFKPHLFGASFQALTIDDVLQALPKERPLDVVKHFSRSQLRIPFRENKEDTISIVEFYLNKQWQDIPQDIQQAALRFIEDKAGVLEQLDCLAVIKRR